MQTMDVCAVIYIYLEIFLLYIFKFIVTNASYYMLIILLNYKYICNNIININEIYLMKYQQNYLKISLVTNLFFLPDI